MPFLSLRQRAVQQVARIVAEETALPPTRPAQRPIAIGLAFCEVSRPISRVLAMSTGDGYGYSSRLYPGV